MLLSVQLFFFQLPFLSSPPIQTTTLSPYGIQAPTAVSAVIQHLLPTCLEMSPALLPVVCNMRLALSPDYRETKVLKPSATNCPVHPRILHPAHRGDPLLPTDPLQDTCPQSTRGRHIPNRRERARVTQQCSTPRGSAPSESESASWPGVSLSQLVRCTIWTGENIRWHVATTIL